MKKRIFGAPSIPAPADSDSDTEFQPAYVRNTAANLYSALLDDGEGNDAAQSLSDQEHGTTEEDSTPVSPPAHTKNKKKKKKKKKPAPVTEGDVEEIVAAVNDMLGAPDTAPTATAAPAAPAVPQFMRIEPRNLNVVNEIKKTYKVDILKEYDNPQQERRRSGWARKTTFVQLKKGWPPVRNTDLSMKLLRSDTDGVKYFCIEHGAQYRNIQLLYLNIVFADQRPALEELLVQHPHHIDTRLLVGHVDGMLKRYADSKEHIEYALFTLEHVLHKQFDLASGACRLEYRHYENRAFHILVLKLARYHYNLACHRSALELCKLLLQLDPSDPLAVGLLIPAIALRANKPAWLIEAIDAWDRSHRALALPNMAYAYAMAHYMLAQDNNETTSRADELLRSAIAKVPSCAVHILEKCGSLQLASIRDLPLYRTQTRDENGSVLWCLSRLTAERQYPVWKRPPQLAWLERVATEAGAARDPAGAARQRRALYRQPPPQLLRHLTVLNHSRIEPPQLADGTPAFPLTDPHPPPDGISPYNTNDNPYWRHRHSGRQTPLLPFDLAQYLPQPF